MAANTGIAIENALLHDEMKKQLVEVKTSYDELYIAQNQILKEARFVTFAEVVGYIKDILSKNQVESSIKEIKRLYKFDPQIKKMMESAQNAFQDVLLKIDHYLEEKRKELNLK